MRDRHTARRIAVVKRLVVATAVVAAVAWASLLIADAVAPFPHEALRRPSAVVVEDRDGTPLRIFLPEDGRYRLPVRFDEVSPQLVRALVASEDRWFWWHPGVNPVAIARAAVANWRAGDVVSGASTIPMQIARMVEPKERTVGGKIAEAFRALQIEWHYDKREILEAYLNLTPYGGNVEGVGAASHLWFGKRASQLSLAEVAMLTALPRSPLRYDPARDPVMARSARDRVLRQLADRGAFSVDEVEEALARPLPERRRRAPLLAPHFAQFAFERGPRDTVRLETTLDLDVQSTVEVFVRTHVARLRRDGIDNAAVVVIDNETRELRAMVGSAAFFDGDHQGQVNGTLAPRSPGSTLKPFLYAQAIDAGLVAPGSYLLDVPTDYAGYIPENYDGRYMGRVTVSEALRLSLNAAAVRLLGRLGLVRFHGLLQRGGLRTLDRPPLHYGLPLILGAGEVRLLDLTNLYVTLAVDGVHEPVRWLRDPRPPPGETRTVAAGRTVRDSRRASREQLISAEAAWLVAEMLREVERPDMPEAWGLTRDVPDVAWKTGTSYGHRDAWAVGFARRWTIGVWIGNPDGRGREGISGARHAGPLLFDLFRALEDDAAGRPRPVGLRVRSIAVCAGSHELPGPFCPRLEQQEVIAGHTGIGTCGLHRRVFVDVDTGERLAGRCLRDRPHVARVVTVFPAELTAWWRARDEPVPGSLPPFSAACDDIPRGDAPRIVSPDATTPYVVRPDAPLAHQGIPLVARADPTVARLFWYQDGVMLGAGPPGKKMFVRPVAGDHRLVVVDSSGRSDAIRFVVE